MSTAGDYTNSLAGISSNYSLGHESPHSWAGNSCCFLPFPRDQAQSFLLSSRTASAQPHQAPAPSQALLSQRMLLTPPSSSPGGSCGNDPISGKDLTIIHCKGDTGEEGNKMRLWIPLSRRLMVKNWEQCNSGTFPTVTLSVLPTALSQTHFIIHHDSMQNINKTEVISTTGTQLFGGFFFFFPVNKTNSEIGELQFKW